MSDKTKEGSFASLFSAYGIEGNGVDAHVAMIGLVLGLPPEGQPLPAARKAHAVKTFASVIEYCYPDAEVAGKVEAPPND